MSATFFDECGVAVVIKTMAEREAGLSEEARKVLAALRKYASEYEDHLSDYTIWGGVYLDNARGCCSHLSGHEWAGYLSALEGAELYEPMSPEFGRVMTGEEE